MTSNVLHEFIRRGEMARALEEYLPILAARLDDYHDDAGTTNQKTERDQFAQYDSRVSPNSKRRGSSTVQGQL